MWEKVKIAVMALVCMGMFLDLSILSRAAENRVCEGGCEMELIEKRVIGIGLPVGNAVAVRRSPLLHVRRNGRGGM